MEQPTQEHEPDKKEEINLSRRGFLKKAGLAMAAGMSATTGLAKMARAAESLISSEDEQERDKLLKDWEDYKKVVINSGVREDITFIEKEYGVESGLSFMANSSLQLFGQLVAAEKSGEDLASSRNKNLLEGALHEFHLYWDQKTFDSIIKKEEQEKGLRAEIKGFERLDGLDNDKVREALEKKFNRRWLYGNISSFEFLPQTQTAKTYGVSGSAINEGIAGVYYKGGEKVILYQEHEGQTAVNQDTLFDILSHEIAHHQDWATNNRLPIHERIQFLREITEAHRSPEHYYSYYAESMIPVEFADKNPKYIKHRVIKEYWAEINKKYDNDEDGAVFKRDFPRESELIGRWRERLTRELI